ncbi:MAG: hypothetical protein M0Z53_09095 [Thermaerobacter sp.]|nr:hypothetical protein [Thermaerobacter sp.]
MNRRQTPRGPFAYFWLALGLLLAVWAWLNVAPAQFGGNKTYLVVKGTSMLPRFHADELVAVTTSPAYQIGQLAAYHNLQLHAVLFHQIVGQIGQRYVFKGLNNPVPDAYHPLASQIVGRLWWSLPHVGLWLAFFHQPWHAAWLMAGLALLVWGGASETRSRAARRQPSRKGRPGSWRRPGLGRERGMVSVSATRNAKTSPAVYTWAAAAIQVFAAICLVGALWAWFSPTQRTAWRSVPYQVRGQFLYQAVVPKGTVYPSGMVTPGSSVFLKLTHTVTIAFAGQWSSPLPKAGSVQGQGELIANMTSSSGWSSSWILAPQTVWTGPTFALKGTLNTDALNARILQVNQETEVPYNTYTLTVTPRVTLHGRLLAEPFSAHLAPPLTFSYSPLLMQLISLNPGTGPLVQLSTRFTGHVNDPVMVPNTLGIGPVQAPVSQVRLVASAGWGAAVLLGLLTWLMKRRWGRRHNAIDRIAAQFGDLLIPVVESEVPSLKGALRVPAIEILVKLADQVDRSILYHNAGGGLHRYILKDGRDTYYYQLQTALTPTDSPPDPQASLHGS